MPEPRNLSSGSIAQLNWTEAVADQHNASLLYRREKRTFAAICNVPLKANGGQRQHWASLKSRRPVFPTPLYRGPNSFVQHAPVFYFVLFFSELAAMPALSLGWIFRRLFAGRKSRGRKRNNEQSRQCEL